MAHCPNLSNPQVKEDFEKLSSVVGDNVAYSLWDRNNGQPLRNTPEGEPSILYRQLIDVYRSEEKAIKAKANIYTDTYLAGNNWLDTGIEPVFDSVEKKLDYSPQKPMNLDPTMEDTPQTVNEQNITEESKITNEERKRQEAVLKAALPQVTKVVYDNTIQDIAEISAGGSTITVNPDKMQADTLGHEYGHLLIDLMGGMSNKFIREGRKQLIGSEAERIVLERYPDLVGTNKFDKEVIATAVGMEAAKIFSREENHKLPVFAKWLLNFFRRLRELTGMTRNNAKVLAQKLTEGKEISKKQLTGQASNYAQQSRSALLASTPEEEIDIIKEYGDRFSLNAEETNYVFDKTDEPYSRTSTLLAKHGLSMTEEDAKADLVLEWQPIGTFVHQQAENINNGLFEITETSEDINMTPEAFEQLKEINKLLFDDYHIIAEVKIGDPAILNAGTMDVFGIHKKTGERVIFDYKTKKKFAIDKRTGQKIPGGFKFYDTPFAGHSASQLKKNAAQLGLYKRMMQKTLGVKVDKLFVVPLVVDFQKTGTKYTITSVELDDATSDGLIEMPNVPKLKDIYDDTASEVAIRKEFSDEKKEATEEEILQKIQALKTAQKKRDLADPLSSKRMKSIKIILSKIARSRVSGKKAEMGRLSNLLDDLLDEEVSNESALISFLFNATNNINDMYNRMKELEAREANGESNVFSLEEVHRWYVSLSAYELLDEIKTLIFEENLVGKSEEEVEDLEDLKKSLQVTIDKKNSVRRMFKTKGIEIVANKLSPYLTLIKEQKIEKARLEWLKNNVDKQRTEKKEVWMKELDAYIRDMLAKEEDSIIEDTKIELMSQMVEASNGDIHVLERWLDSPINSNDPLVAAMASKFSVVWHRVRKESLGFKNELVDIVRDLESATGYSTSTNPQAMYDFMLEHDEKGVATGYILDKFSGKLITTMYRMLDSTKSLPDKKKIAQRDEWFNTNMPLEINSFRDGFIARVDELIASGELVEELRETVMYHYNFPKGYYASPATIPSNANNLLVSWVNDNRMDYREPAEKWKSKEYEDLLKILEDEKNPRSVFYNKIKTMTTKMDKVLSEESRLYGQLPFVLKSGRERQLAGQEITTIVMNNVKKALQIQKEDVGRVPIVESIITDETDNPIDLVPTYYKRDHKTYSSEDQSFDLGTIFTMWHNMAVNYREMTDIQPEIESVRTFLKERTYATLNSKGKRMMKTMDALGDVELSKENKNSYILNQFEDWAKSLMYGQSTLNMGEFSLLGFKVDTGKFLEGVSMYTAYNLLGMNVLQSINNVNFGEISNIIEAMSGEHFNMKDLHSATNSYWQEIIPMMGDIGSRKPESFLGIFTEEFDVLSDPDNTRFRESTKFAQLMKASTSFFMQHAGEHFMQTRVMMAMMKKVDAVDKNGKVLGSMYDMYAKHWAETKAKSSLNKGTFGLPKEVDLVKSGWTADEQSLFTERVKGVLSRIHGEYSELGTIAIQRHVLGKMALAFRKFAVPGFNKRWAGKRFNQRLGVFTHGTNREGSKFLWRLIGELRAHGFEAAVTEWYSNDFRTRNAVKRMLAEVNFFLLMIGLSSLMFSLRGESDEDRDNLAYQVIHMTALRTSKELAFFVNPIDAMSILRSPAAAMSSIENTIRFATRIATGGMTEQYKYPGLYKYKIEKDLVNMIPIVRQGYRVASIDDTIKLMQLKR